MAVSGDRHLLSVRARYCKGSYVVIRGDQYVPSILMLDWSEGDIEMSGLKDG